MHTDMPLIKVFALVVCGQWWTLERGYNVTLQESRNQHGYKNRLGLRVCK